SWSASAPSTVSRSSTPRWSNATAILTGELPLPCARPCRAAPPPRVGRPSRRPRRLTLSHPAPGKCDDSALLSPRTRSSDPLQERGRARDDVVDVEAEALEHGRAGRGGAEPLQLDRRAALAAPLRPPERDARPAGEPGVALRWKQWVGDRGDSISQLEELP